MVVHKKCEEIVKISNLTGMELRICDMIVYTVIYYLALYLTL